MVVGEKKMENEKCLSFIDGNVCQNIRNSTNWCIVCADILLPKYNRYKKLEDKYYNSQTISDIEHYSIEKLLSIYAKVSQIIKLRTEVRNSGFQPQYRDLGHMYRIHQLQDFLWGIEKLLKTKYTDDIHAAYRESIESDETEDITEESNQVIIDVPGKPAQTKPEISIEEQNLLDCYRRNDAINQLYNRIAIDLINGADKFLAPKFGKYFVRSFILQQKTINSLCHHSVDMLKGFKNIKKFKNKERTYIKMDPKDHRFVSYTEIIKSIITRDHTIYEKAESKFMTNVYRDLFDWILVLYEYIPQIPLPPYMDSIKFTIDTDSDEERLIELAKLHCPCCHERCGLVEEYMEKIRLIKTRKCKSPVSLNNCIRVSRFSEIQENEQLVTEMKLTIGTNLENRPNHIAIRTKKQVIGNTSLDIEKTDWDYLDVTNFRCTCKAGAVIRINKIENLTDMEHCLLQLTCAGQSIFA